MELEEKFITEELNLSREYDTEALMEMDSHVRAAWGMSAEEYIDMRNNLLRKHNGIMPYEVLTKEILNKIIIDLIGRGYLKADLDTLPRAESSESKGFKIEITQKGFRSIVQAMSDGDLVHDEDDSLAAIMYLRNNNLLG